MPLLTNQKMSQAKVKLKRKPRKRIISSSSDRSIKELSCVKPLPKKNERKRDLTAPTSCRDEWCLNTTNGCKKSSFWICPKCTRLAPCVFDTGEIPFHGAWFKMFLKINSPFWNTRYGTPAKRALSNWNRKEGVRGVLVGFVQAVAPPFKRKRKHGNWKAMVLSLTHFNFDMIDNPNLARH